MDSRSPFSSFLMSQFANALGRSSPSSQSPSSPSPPVSHYPFPPAVHGKLGPDVVTLDRSACSSTGQIGRDNLTYSSINYFSSARANCGVYAGKWMYECTLNSGGLQQIGWTTIETSGWSLQEGVGDQKSSFAYDGHRVYSWNLEHKAYGQPWETGDVIGVLVDMDTGKMSFSRNGIDLGVAFKAPIGPNCVYFPGISLSEGESCTFNFGALPFLYPVPGFRSLHLPPSWATESAFSSSSSSSSSAPDSLSSLSQQLQSLFTSLSSSSSSAATHFSDEQILESYQIIHSFAPYLSGEHAPYTLASHFVPALIEIAQSDKEVSHRLGLQSSAAAAAAAAAAVASSSGMDLEMVSAAPVAAAVPSGTKPAELLRQFSEPNEQDFEDIDADASSSPGAGSLPPVSSLKLLIDALDMCLEKDDFDAIFKAILHRLGYLARTTVPNRFPFSQYSPLHPTSVALSLLRDRRVRIAWMHPDHQPPMQISAYKSAFIEDLESLLFVKQPTAIDLVSIFPSVTWPGCRDPSFAGNAESFRQARRDAANGQYRLDTRLRFPLIDLLLNDITPFSSSSSKSPSSVLKDAINDIIERNLAAARHAESGRQRPTVGVSHPSILLTLSNALLRSTYTTLHPVLTSLSSAATVPVGFATALARVLGYDSLIEKCDMNRFGGLISHLRKHYPLASKSSLLPSSAMSSSEGFDSLKLYECLTVFDRAVFLCSLGMKAQFSGPASRAADARRSWEKANQSSNVQRADFDKAAEVARLMAWDYCSVLRNDNENVLLSMGGLISRAVLCLVSSNNNGDEDKYLKNLVHYMPMYWLETAIGIVYDIKQADPPFAFFKPSSSSSPAGETGLSPAVSSDRYSHSMSIIDAIARCLNDTRIVVPDIKDLMISAFTIFLQSPSFAKGITESPQLRKNAIIALFVSFDDKYWPTICISLGKIFAKFGFGPSKDEMTEDQTLIAAHRALCSEFGQCLLSTASSAPAHAMSAFKASQHFLNQLFNNLSLVLQEQQVAMREIVASFSASASSNAQRRLSREQTVRRCALTFELSGYLLRLLESIVREAPTAIFVQPVDDNVQVVRACEVFTHVLLHFSPTSKDAALYSEFLSKDVIPAQKTNRKSILNPICGFLAELSRHDQAKRFADVLMATQAVGVPDIALHGMLDEVEHDERTSKEQQANLQNTVDVLLETARQSVAASKAGAAQDGTPMVEEEDENLCPICYSFPKSVKFGPCGHEACTTCLNRHLLNSTRCPFCNAEIKKL